MPSACLVHRLNKTYNPINAIVKPIILIPPSCVVCVINKVGTLLAQSSCPGHFTVVTDRDQAFCIDVISCLISMCCRCGDRFHLLPHTYSSPIYFGFHNC